MSPPIRSHVHAQQVGVLAIAAVIIGDRLEHAKGAAADGRTAESLTWGGLFNIYYWIDPARRIAAAFMTQVLPTASF
jgi:hypothetical protein